MRSSVYIVCPSVLSSSDLKLHQTLEVKNIFKQENIMLQLTFNPGLTLIGFRTTRPSSLNLLFSAVAVAVAVVVFLNSLVTHQRRKNLGIGLQQPEFSTISKVSLKSTHSFTGHQIHLSQLLLEIVKKKGVCRLSVLVPSPSLQQELGPIPHSADVCQSTRQKKAK